MFSRGARAMLSEPGVLLPLGHVGMFQYDMTISNTTKVNLKVLLSVRTVQAHVVNNNKDAMFGYFVEAGDQTSNERGIFSMPALFHLPER